MKRIEYLDTTKAYLIFFVVLSHVLILMNPGYDNLYLSCIQSFINCYQMPAFFIVHGIVFNNSKWKEKRCKEYLIKKIKTLVVPYLFFECVGIIWKFLFCNQDLLTGIKNMLVVKCNVGADWFLIAMFIGSILFLPYVKLPNKYYGIASIIVAFSLAILMSENQLTIVIGRGLVAYGFIMLGNMAKELFCSETVKKVPCVIMTFFVTVAVALISVKWAGNDLYTCDIANPATLVIGGISGTLMVLGTSQIISSKFITAVGKQTLIIMGTHQLVIYFVINKLSSLSQMNSFLYGAIVFVIIICFEIPVIFIISKYIPFVIGKSKAK